jgi:hypothetical protein
LPQGAHPRIRFFVRFFIVLDVGSVGGNAFGARHTPIEQGRSAAVVHPFAERFVFENSFGCPTLARRNVYIFIFREITLFRFHTSKYTFFPP